MWEVWTNVFKCTESLLCHHHHDLLYNQEKETPYMSVF